jgi:hypothetical protein
MKELLTKLVEAFHFQGGEKTLLNGSTESTIVEILGMIGILIADA